MEANLSKQTGRVTVAISALLLSASLIFQGVRVSWNRSVQEFEAGTRFAGDLKVGGMGGVKWADLSYAQRLRPSFASQGVASTKDWWLRKADLEGLDEWLTRHPGNFFVFGDSTMLYGLHHRVSPQPWLYFLEGHSYLPADLPRMDEAVVNSLTRNAIRTVVVEKVSWGGYQDAASLSRLPQLNSWITANFVKQHEFGIYEVWAAKSARATETDSR